MKQALWNTGGDVVISEGDDDDGEDLMLTRCNRSSAYHGPGMAGGSLDACIIQSSFSCLLDNAITPFLLMKTKSQRD